VLVWRKRVEGFMMRGRRAGGGWGAALCYRGRQGGCGGRVWGCVQEGVARVCAWGDGGGRRGAGQVVGEGGVWWGGGWKRGRRGRGG